MCLVSHCDWKDYKINEINQLSGHLRILCDLEVGDVTGHIVNVGVVSYKKTCLLMGKECECTELLFDSDLP